MKRGISKQIPLIIDLNALTVLTFGKLGLISLYNIRIRPPCARISFDRIKKEQPQFSSQLVDASHNLKTFNK